MQSIGKYRRELQNSLGDLYDTGESKTIAFLLISHVTGLDKSQILAYSDDMIREELIPKLNDYKSQLLKGKPIQYILGFTDFMSFSFKVDESVLIPRPETEELVRWIIEDFKDSAELKILDIGTGTACIICSLAKSLNTHSCTGIDISENALALASENAVNLDLRNINFYHTDILKTPLSFPSGNYDIIVSNPPYVRIEEKELMHTNVLENEPHTALFVPHDDPDIFYRRIFQLAKSQLLKEKGTIYFELNEARGGAIIELAHETGYTSIEIRKDVFGKDRMMRIR